MAVFHTRYLQYARVNLFFGNLVAGSVTMTDIKWNIVEEVTQSDVDDKHLILYTNYAKDTIRKLSDGM